jgi:hypothetical protein
MRRRMSRVVLRFLCSIKSKMRPLGLESAECGMIDASEWMRRDPGWPSVWQFFKDWRR